MHSLCWFYNRECQTHSQSPPFCFHRGMKMVCVGPLLADIIETTYKNGQTFSLFSFGAEETSSITVNSGSRLQQGWNKFHEVDKSIKTSPFSSTPPPPSSSVPPLPLTCWSSRHQDTTSPSHLDRIMSLGKAHAHTHIPSKRGSAARLEFLQLRGQFLKTYGMFL